MRKLLCCLLVLPVIGCATGKPCVASAAKAASGVGEVALFVLYVQNQAASSRFYEQVLDRPPSLDVPGMTQFDLAGGAKLGLMPETGIKRLLGEKLPDPGNVGRASRAELYLLVDDPAAFHARAIASGAKEIDALKLRDWGDLAAYSLDPDGYVLGFAMRAIAEEAPRE